MIRRNWIQLGATAKSLAAAISALLAASCSSVSNITLVSEDACYRPLFTETEPTASLWPDIASVCAAASHNQSTHNVDGIVNALINAGSAERRLGHPPGQPFLQGQTAPAAPVAAGHFEQAAALLVRAHTLNTDRHDATLELAWVRFGQNRLDDAMTLTNDVLRVLPTQNSLHATAHYLRGWISDARHDEDAALGDWQELVSDALDEHPYALEARRSIIEVATRVGMAAMRAQTREGSESAVGYFTRAQGAAEAASWNLPWPVQVTIPPPPEAPQSAAQRISVYAADIFMNLGDAKLQMAGLTSQSGIADFNCAAGVADPDWLNRAQQDFDSATQKAPRSDKAWRRLACADLALGRANAALTAAHQAASLAAGGGSEAAEDHRMLGRVLAVTGPADEAASAFQTAAQYTSDNPTRAAIHTELAAVYYVDADSAQSVHPAGAPPQNQLQTARGYLQHAVQEDPYYALAHLRLGIVYFDNQEYARANDELSRVARLAQHQPPPQPPSDLTNPAFTEHHDPRQHLGDRPVRAEALYYRSRIGAETENQNPDYSQDADIGCPRHGSTCMAIALADEAFRLQAAQRYREQACLARIRFLRVYDGDHALNYCATTGLASPDANAFLLQGMYYLARAHIAFGSTARNEAWDAADRSFADGLRMVETAANDPAGRRLRALLLQGHATAQYCVGLTVAGHQIEASIAAQMPDQAAYAHRHFEIYHVMQCPR